jgi:hypothetical protein
MTLAEFLVALRFQHIDLLHVHNLSVIIPHGGPGKRPVFRGLLPRPLMV